MRSYWLLVRPKQYVKNIFIFLPLVFSLNISNVQDWIALFGAFIAFSLTASAIYILNDIHDVEDDRRHPRKCFRPIAARKIPVLSARIFMVGLLCAGFFLAWIINKTVLGILICYFLLNLGYTYHFKHLPLFDVTILSIGFVLRLFTGAVTVGVTLSIWIILMTFLLALFLAFAKRRDDVLLSIHDGVQARRAMKGYNLDLLNVLMGMMATIVIVCYIMYTVSEDVLTRLRAKDLYLTVIFVILGIFRYMQIAFVDKNSGSPTDVLWNDKFLQVCVCSWFISFVYLISRSAH